MPETHTISRQAEFFSEPELVKQIGFARHDWTVAIIKELIDNAMDACEESNVAPAIDVIIDESGITVSDNGPGFPPEHVAKLADFQTRSSSRAYSRAPTRGAQGNAGKTILALPYVLNGGVGRTVITACGHRTEITVGFDEIEQTPKVSVAQREHFDGSGTADLASTIESSEVGQNVQNKHLDRNENDDLASTIDQSRKSENVQNEHHGTKVEVLIADLASTIDNDEIARIVSFAQSYSLLNPHLTLSVTIGGASNEFASRGKVQKWTPDKPDPPNWHDSYSFQALVAATIRNDVQAGVDRPVSEFIRSFDGMRRQEAVARALESTGLKRKRMSDLTDGDSVDDVTTFELFEALLDAGKVRGAEALGKFQKRQVQTFFQDCLECDPETFRFKSVSGQTWDRLPFVVTAAFAERAEPTSAQILTTGVNYSPTVNGSLCDDLSGFLESQLIKPDSPVAIVVHVAIVNPTYADRGKSRILPDADTLEAIEQATANVAKDWRRKKEAEGKNAVKEQRRRERAERRRESQSMTMKDAILRVLPDAVATARGKQHGRYDARDLYYQIRPLVQRFNSSPLNQNYLETVIDEYESQHGILEGRLRSPRGFFLEPHTGTRVPLGTAEVDDYDIPMHLYQAILYVEKKNVIHALEYAQILERYDIAVIAAEGYAVRAAKTLAEAAQKTIELPVLCLHDADPHGKNIARTLNRESGAHSYDLQVIDIGLSLDEAINELDLPSEKFSRNQSLPSELTLTGLESKLWHAGKRKASDCERVELNALTADKDRFTEWLERKLEEQDIVQKLTPPVDEIMRFVSDYESQTLRSRVERELMDRMGFRELTDRVMESVGELEKDDPVARLKDWRETLAPERWTNACESLVDDALAHHGDEISETIDDVIGNE